MPNPQLVPIFWGHDYIENPTTVSEVQQMISDLVTGPFMNGLAQYGVGPVSLLSPAKIDDQNPPATITYRDSNDNLVDEITPKLVGWINAGLVPAPPSPSDINQLYLILPPPWPKTTPQTYNEQANPPGAIRPAKAFKGGIMKG